MSQKLMLVKYVLEDEIPIDESSENLQSAYIPNELVDWMMENEWSSEIEIKESEGGTADIPVTVIDDGKDNCVKSILEHIESRLIKCIEEANSHISTAIILPSKELENDFAVLHVWLNVHEILKEKAEKYHDNHNIKLIVG
jgi:hypothetical protein